MPQSFACLHYHLIFSTKHRDPLLVGDLPNRLYAYVGGILRNGKCALLAAGVCRTTFIFWSRSAVNPPCRTSFGKSKAADHDPKPPLLRSAWRSAAHPPNPPLCKGGKDCLRRHHFPPLVKGGGGVRAHGRRPGRAGRTSLLLRMGVIVAQRPALAAPLAKAGASEQSAFAACSASQFQHRFCSRSSIKPQEAATAICARGRATRWLSGR